jgi:hypothetical protein
MSVIDQNTFPEAVPEQLRALASKALKASGHGVDRMELVAVRRCT